MEKKKIKSSDSRSGLKDKSTEKNDKYLFDPYFLEYSSEEEKYNQFAFVCIDNLE